MQNRDPPVPDGGDAALKPESGELHRSRTGLNGRTALGCKKRRKKMDFRKVGKPGFGYRIDFERFSEALLKPSRGLMDQTGCLTGNVGDCLGRAASMAETIKDLDRGMKLGEPALTVQVPPTDELMIHKALPMTKPGGVLVVAGGGNRSWALLG